jgi:hypothetical protein
MGVVSAMFINGFEDGVMRFDVVVVEVFVLFNKTEYMVFL